jgi:hypothetical protein
MTSLGDSKYELNTRRIPAAIASVSEKIPRAFNIMSLVEVLIRSYLQVSVS